MLTSGTTPADSVPVAAPVACPLSACVAGSRATVLEVRCGDVEACRLRALGLCEGASVSVVRSRDCTLLEVRGARLAVGSAIAAGIVVLPLV
jgi:Fe2+ transport system protein FeoA